MKQNSNTAILLLSCPDAKGIVAEVANFIFKNNGNIIYSDQHTDIDSSTFFLRIEWELDSFSLKPEQIANHFIPIAKKFEMQFDLKFSKDIINTAIFVSKYDHCLWDLLLRHKAGELNANIKVIISNHMELEQVARSMSIEYVYFPINKKNKKQQEESQLKLLKDKKIEFIILARYMQILGKKFIEIYENKIINIHHSFLPAFVGANPYKQAFDRGVKIIGATSHIVTEELDKGPIIEQDVIKVSHRDTVDDMIRKGKDIEKIVLARAVHLFLKNKILVHKKKCIVFD